MGSFAFGTALGVGVRSAFTLLTIGFIVAAITYTSGAISGPRYNPVVTFAVMLRTDLGGAHLTFGVKEASVYIPAQGLGATLGAIAG